MAHKLVNYIKDIVSKIASPIINQKRNKRKKRKLSEKTVPYTSVSRKKELQAQQTIGKVEYAELCKLTRKQIRNDLRRFNYELYSVQSYIEQNKSYK